jgi:hypothetical protein
MIAEIKDNRSIKVIPVNDLNSSLDENIFMPYDGYTVSEIRDLVSRINSWHEAHPSWRNTL